MNGVARRAKTLELLASRGPLTVEEFAGLLDVTESTVRRDLQRLAAEGAITRTLGGAILPGTTGTEQTLAQRSQESRAEKDAIGRWCADLISPGETVMLDAGTTTGRVAAALRHRAEITVITTGVTSLLELATAEGVEVILLGGRLRHISQGLVGAMTDLTLSRVTADRVFLGADAIHATFGICEADLEQTRTKELMAQRGREVYVLADSSKLGLAPFDAWAQVGAYTLVTDWTATAAQLAPFREAGIDVILAPVDAAAA
ncbi:DeoR/GlpR family DNA-binding transcription regulator [Microbacterium sp. A8/3-1]|uniref:DeoR/GlpR family DNA-binding transcription regulator n=1 Tax=Microbacterium sp. A8/3-1 TaxID=3160749 RepID=A0AAU7W4Y7_9MICO